jgi:hypothetical protein
MGRIARSLFARLECNVRLASLALIIFGWVIVLVGAFGTGINFKMGNLDPLMTGIVLVLGGITLRVVP